MSATLERFDPRLIRTPPVVDGGGVYVGKGDSEVVAFGPASAPPSLEPANTMGDFILLVFVITATVVGWRRTRKTLSGWSVIRARRRRTTS